MDQWYDIENAAKTLESISAGRRLNDTYHLANISKASEHHSNSHSDDLIVVQDSGRGKQWKIIVAPSIEPTEREELVLSIQGIITQKDLPPIQPLHTKDRDRYRFLSQRVRITGLGTSSFQSCIDNLLWIHGLFARHMPEGSLEVVSIPNMEQFLCMDFSTRYFTSRREDPMGEVVPFQKHVDPKSTLQSLSTGDLFHGQDNKVIYYTLLKDDTGGKHKFTITDPARFRIGDLVEIQMTVVAVPVKGGRFKMITQLRTLAQLDCHFSHQAATHRSKSFIKPPVVKASIKRKIGYGDYDEDGDRDDDMYTARRKMLKMLIVDEH